MVMLNNQRVYVWCEMDSHGELWSRRLSKYFAHVFWKSTMRSTKQSTQQKPWDTLDTVDKRIHQDICYHLLSFAIIWYPFAIICYHLLSFGIHLLSFAIICYHLLSFGIHLLSTKTVSVLSFTAWTVQPSQATLGRHGLMPILRPNESADGSETRMDFLVVEPGETHRGDSGV